MTGKTHRRHPSLGHVSVLILDPFSGIIPLAKHAALLGGDSRLDHRLEGRYPSAPAPLNSINQADEADGVTVVCCAPVKWFCMPVLGLEVRHDVVSNEYMRSDGDSGGWIRLYRSVFFHEFADEPWDRITAWMYLISLAAYKPYDAAYRRHVYHLERGQVAIVMSDLASKAGWSKQKVKRFFALLIKKDMIEVTSDSICCVLTILNYEKYQAENGGTPVPATVPAIVPAIVPANASRILTVEGMPVPAIVPASVPPPVPQNKNVFKNEDQEQKSSRQKDPGDDPVVALYSRVCVPKGFPSIKTLTHKREVAIKRAIDTYGLEHLEALFRKAVTSDFLLGRLHSAKYPGWKADFDFLLKPETLVHIDEGSRYFDRQPIQRGLTDVHAWDDVKGW